MISLSGDPALSDWRGVLKRRLLFVYGRPFLGPVIRPLLPRSPPRRRCRTGPWPVGLPARSPTTRGAAGRTTFIAYRLCAPIFSTSAILLLAAAAT